MYDATLTRHYIHAECGSLLLEFLICLPLSIMLLSGMLRIFLELSKEVSLEAILQRNLSNLTWRLARSIEDDINSAPLALSYLLSSTYAPALFDHSSFMPSKNSGVIVSSRLLIPGPQTVIPPQQRTLGIAKNMLCEYRNSGTNEIRSLIFNNDCPGLIGFVPIVHTHLYFVDTKNTLRLMSIEGEVVTENQPVYSSIKSIYLDRNGIEVTALNGAKSYAVIIARTTQLSLEDFGKILPVLTTATPRTIIE